MLVDAVGIRVYTMPAPGGCRATTTLYVRCQVVDVIQPRPPRLQTGGGTSATSGCTLASPGTWDIPRTTPPSPHDDTSRAVVRPPRKVWMTACGGSCAQWREAPRAWQPPHTQPKENNDARVQDLLRQHRHLTWPQGRQQPDTTFVSTVVAHGGPRSLRPKREVRGACEVVEPADIHRTHTHRVSTRMATRTWHRAARSHGCLVPKRVGGHNTGVPTQQLVQQASRPGTRPQQKDPSIE